MSNVTIFRDQKSVATAAPQGIDEITRRLLGNGGLSIKRISIKGGKWRMMSSGEQIATSNSDTLDVVVANAAPHVSRYWYKEGYTGKNAGAPDCWSNDGTRPDPKSRQPQHNICEGCPKNIAGSGTNGTGRACRYARRLAVALVGQDGISSDVYQIQLPPTSMFGKAKDEDHMGLDAYVRHLAGYNYSITGVVTEMRFDPNAESPRIYFRGVRMLNNEERAEVAEKGQTPEALAAIAFNPGTLDSGPVSAPAAAPVQPKASPFRDEEPEEEAKPVAKKAEPVFVEEEAPKETVAEAQPELAEPVIRRSQPKAQEPAAKVDMAKLIEEWDLDDDE